MKHQCKEIFQKLRPAEPDTGHFDTVVVPNWYRARRYVLDSFPDWTGGGIGPKSSRAFRIAIQGHGPLVYSVVRHIALLAHFPNFNEGTGKNISTITILYPKEFGLKKLEAEIDCLAREEYLCNLIRHSTYILEPADEKERKVKPGLPFLDIQFVLKATDSYSKAPDETLITKEGIEKIVENDHDMFLTDRELAAAMLVNQAYSAGEEISNLSSTENEKANRYGLALKCLNGTKRKITKESWHKNFRNKTDGDDKLTRSQINNILSCIFCADTFESRIQGLMADAPKRFTHKTLLSNANTIHRLIAGNLKALSECEHSRWNAEKLILGFSPLSRSESYTDEIKLNHRNDYRKGLKKRDKAPAHIDLVSNADLKRINPDDLKYDCFIMLAMPTILMQKYRPQNLIGRLLTALI